MASFRIAVNMEFCRSADKSFEAGVRIAAELGYELIEPMVHTGWELLSEVGYFHSFSLEEDPLLMAEICARHGVPVASISGHSPLMKPEAAVPRLTRAIVLADALGARWVNTDEMLKPDWMDDDLAHEVMRYTLTKADLVARRHDVYVCVEPHGVYTKTAAGLRGSSSSSRPSGSRSTGTPATPTWPGSRTRTRASRACATTSATCTPRTSRSSTPSASAASSPARRSAARAATGWSTGSACCTSSRRSTASSCFSVECGTIDQAERSLRYLRSLL